MIKIKELNELPFVEVTVTFRGQSLVLENVLIEQALLEQFLM